MRKYNTHRILLLAASAFCALATISCKQSKSTKEEIRVKKDTVSTLGTLPRNSIYQLEGTWLTQDNKSIKLSDLRGNIQVISMIFTHCKYACPRNIGNIQDIENGLPANIKNQVRYTLVSFDVDRDTIARLKKFAQDMALDSNWTLLRGNEEEVRELSMLLDVNFEKVENGDFNHTIIITILDQNGVIVYRHEGLAIEPKEEIQKIVSIAK